MLVFEFNLGRIPTWDKDGTIDQGNSCSMVHTCIDLDEATMAFNYRAVSTGERDPIMIHTPVRILAYLRYTLHPTRKPPTKPDDVTDLGRLIAGASKKDQGSAL